MDIDRMIVKLSKGGEKCGCMLPKDLSLGLLLT